MGHVYVPIDEVGKLLSSSPLGFPQDDGRQMEAPRDPCDPHGVVSEPSQLLHEAWQVQQQLWQLEQQIQLQQQESQILAQLKKLQALDRFHEGSGKFGVCGSTSDGEQHLRQVQVQHRLQ